jgi:FtsH-binding integral membrane protein
MNNYYGNNFGSGTKVGTRTSAFPQVNVNAFMTRVFAIMGIGLLITAVASLGIAQSDQLFNAIFGSGLRWVVMFAPLAIVFLFSFGFNRMSYTTAALVFGLYSLTMGISLSVIFKIYTATSIASTFFISAGMFGAMAFIGATTKRDLTKFGSILMMALIGLILASIVNIFLGSSMMSWIISLITVIVFCGFTAYDMQKLMDISHAEDGSEWAKKAALMGALTLYIDFINIFLSLLRLLGDRE